MGDKEKINQMYLSGRNKKANVFFLQKKHSVPSTVNIWEQVWGGHIEASQCWYKSHSRTSPVPPRSSRGQVQKVTEWPWTHNCPEQWESFLFMQNSHGKQYSQQECDWLNEYRWREKSTSISINNSLMY